MVMEDGWGRRHDFAEMDESAINSLLAPAFPGKRLVAAELLTAGRCNTNYKIRVSGIEEALVLRLYTRDHAACHKDWDILNLVRDRVAVPEMLYAQFDHDHAELPVYSVMKWVDGTLLSDVLATQNVDTIVACAYQTGSTLASIGSYTFPQAGFFGQGLIITQPFGDEAASYSGAIEHFLFNSHCSHHLGSALTERLWLFVTRNAEYLHETGSPAALVHSDFKGANILVRQEKSHWDVAGILDWEFAFAGSPLFDIANMLRYAHLLPSRFEEAFIRGFHEQGGHLPAEWKKRAKMCDLLSLCEFLSQPDCNPKMIQDVRGLIINTIACWHNI
jgi:aminoglycoside phosphotransferase (APT) family kinase protein